MRTRITRWAAAAAVLLLFAVALEAQRPRTSSGTVVKVQAEERSVVIAPEGGGDQLRVEWNSETRITGTLAPGARVTVRFLVQEDGRNLAQQITVARG